MCTMAARELLYVPMGWIVAEQVTGKHAIGVRCSVLRSESLRLLKPLLDELKMSYSGAGGASSTMEVLAEAL